MNNSEGDLGESASNSVARYAYMSSGQPSLSPSYTFDPPPSNISASGSPADPPFLPRSENRGFVASSEQTSAASTTGVDSVCRSGESAVYDGGETAQHRDGSAYFDGKDPRHSMSFYSNRIGGMHGLASLNEVANFYGSHGHFSHSGESFSKDGEADRPSLFPPQLAADGSVPSTSLYSGLPENYSGRRGVDNGALSHRHSATERASSSFSRSMPAYIPLNNDSNYVYINPPSLSSFNPSEFPFPANMHSSFGSLMGHSASYGRMTATPPSHDRFLAATTSSSHRFAVGEEENIRSAVADSFSRLRYDSVFAHNQLGVPLDWNHSSTAGIDRESEMLDSQHNNKTQSPKTDIGMRSVGNHPDTFSWDGSLPKESKTTPVRNEDATVTKGNDATTYASHHSYSASVFPQNEMNLINTHYRDASALSTTSRSSPVSVASHTDQASADHPSYVEDSPRPRHVDSPKYAAGANPFHLHANISRRLPVASSKSSHTPPLKSSSAAFAVTPNIYSESSNSEEDVKVKTQSKPKADVDDNRLQQNSNCALADVSDKSSMRERMKSFDRNQIVTPAFETSLDTRYMTEGDSLAVKEEPLQSDGSSSEYESQSPRTSTQDKYQDSTLSQKRFTTTLAEDFDKGEGDVNPRIRLIIKKEKSVPALKKPRLLKHHKAKSKMSASGAKKFIGIGRKVDNRTCPICQKIFSRADSLTCHMRVHTGDRPYQCELCDANYKIAGHLRDHVRSKHSNSRPYLCAKCGKSFAYPTARRRHEKVCGMDLSQRIEFHCTNCEKGFVTAKGFMKHQKTCCGDTDSEGVAQVQETPFKCLTCGQSFATFPGLDRHQRFVCGRTPQKGLYACEECGKTFQKRHRYIDHTRRHAGDKPYKCSRCDMSFFDKATLKKHIDRHEGNKRYKCCLCEASFYSKQCLSQHNMRIHCGVKPFKCNECEAEFSSRPLLSRHIRNIHREEKLIECKLCGKGFFDSGTWKKHMQWHARPFRSPPVRQHTCNVCSKSFLWKDLRTHIATQHPGITLSKALGKDLLKCDVCSKELSCQLSLSLHKLRHSGLKRFMCDYCDMQFYFKHALDRHKRKHTDRRPFACQECGKSFRWSATLSQHMISQHKAKGYQPYSCQECGKTFRWSFLLAQHRMNEHPSKTEETMEADNKSFTCNECGEQFKQETALNEHLKCHGKVMHCICYQCGVGFVDVNLYKTHMSTHDSDGPKPFVCQTCGAAYHHQNLLDQHTQHAHPQQQAVWLCEDCGKSFSCREDLLKHVPRHSKYKGGKTPKPGSSVSTGTSMCDQNQAPNPPPLLVGEGAEMNEQATGWSSAMQPEPEVQPYADPATPNKPDLAQQAAPLPPLPNDVLPDFSMFGGQNYRQRFTTFIHQTLPWPRLEEH